MTDFTPMPALLGGLLIGLAAVLLLLNGRIAGTWDPSLLLVLGGATGLALVACRLVLRRPAPLFDARLHLPEVTALFGVGWGLAGYCPGPAFASIGLGNAEALWIVPAMLAGAALQQVLLPRR
jgi:uncharacterized membrane protein YedE/YeeE